ncbi:hypothetical protein B4U80_13433 [Leptotrombidium deliense]|uniref:Ig-like domain-containing protein n=1 Tax=Leptotrombidium deliense TaxID=299467 RepID=A0A443S6G7_9ACAR|nr:hypothetical protein B4U80_13433 [Leptotrombidium deliense]
MSYDSKINMEETLYEIDSDINSLNEVLDDKKKEFESLLERYEIMKERLEELMMRCELAHNNHSDYNDHKERIDNWFLDVKRRFPAMNTHDQRNMSTFEHCIQLHEKLKNKRNEGNELLEKIFRENVKQTSLESYSPTIPNEYKEYESKVNSPFAEIDNNTNFLKNSIGVMDFKQDLRDKLKVVKDWFKNNPKNELLPDTNITSIGDTLNAMEVKNKEWQTMRDILVKVYEALKTGEHEEHLIHKYTELCKEIESYDWDSLIRKFGERLKQLIKFVEDPDNLKNAVKQINTLIDIIDNSCELLNVLAPTDNLGNKKFQLEFVEAILNYMNSIQSDNILQGEVIEDENETIHASKVEREVHEIDLQPNLCRIEGFYLNDIGIVKSLLTARIGKTGRTKVISLRKYDIFITQSAVVLIKVFEQHFRLLLRRVIRLVYEYTSIRQSQRQSVLLFLSVLLQTYFLLLMNMRPRIISPVYGDALIVRGHRLHLWCRIFPVNGTSFYWTRNDEAVQESSTIHVFRTNDMINLIIEQTRTNDSGFYTVVVRSNFWRYGDSRTQEVIVINNPVVGIRFQRCLSTTTIRHIGTSINRGMNEILRRFGHYVRELRCNGMVVFICDICQRTFIFRFAWARHFVNEHAGQPLRRASTSN